LIYILDAGNSSCKIFHPNRINSIFSYPIEEGNYRIEIVHVPVFTAKFRHRKKVATY